MFADIFRSSLDNIFHTLAKTCYRGCRECSRLHSMRKNGRHLVFGRAYTASAVVKWENIGRAHPISKHYKTASLRTAESLVSGCAYRPRLTSFYTYVAVSRRLRSIYYKFDVFRGAQPSYLVYRKHYLANIRLMASNYKAGVALYALFYTRNYFFGRSHARINIEGRPTLRRKSIHGAVNRIMLNIG